MYVAADLGARGSAWRLCRLHWFHSGPRQHTLCLPAHPRHHSGDCLIWITAAKDLIQKVTLVLPQGVSLALLLVYIARLLGLGDANRSSGTWSLVLKPVEPQRVRYL